MFTPTTLRLTTLPFSACSFLASERREGVYPFRMVSSKDFRVIVKFSRFRAAGPSEAGSGSPVSHRGSFKGPLITTWFSNSYEQAAVGIKQDLRLLAGSPVVGEAGEALHQAPVIRLAALYHGPTSVPGFCTHGRTTQRSPY